MCRLGLLAGIGIIIASIACGKSEAIDPAIEKLGRASSPAKPVAKGQPAAENRGLAPKSSSPAVHSGEIVETIQVPNYTYLLLLTGTGDRVWTAVPSAEVQVGQQVQVQESIVMRDFRSRTLNRTFTTIVFGTLRGELADPAASDGGLPVGHPPLT